MSDQKYKLTLTKKQADVISRCTEFFARVQLGQVEDLRHQLLDNKHVLGLSDTTKQKIKSLLNEIHTLITGSANESLSIHSLDISEDAQTAWDIYQVIRHVLAWERCPEGGIQVSFHEPRQTSKEPLTTLVNTGVEKEERS